MAPDTIPFKVLDRGGASGIEQLRTVVVRTPDEWTTLLREHGSAKNLPPVDFSHTTVIGVFLGSRPTGGYTVEIARIDRDGDALVVSYQERKPAPDVITTQVITMPYQLVTIDRFTGPVRFLKIQ
jgi:hypothetical protein